MRTHPARPLSAEPVEILHDGELEAVDTPRNLFSFPSSRFVAGCALGAGASACVAVPRHDVRPGLPEEQGSLVLEGVVEDVSYLGNVVDVTLALAGSDSDSDSDSEPITVGATLPSAQMSTVTPGTPLICHVPSTSLVVVS